MSTRAKLFAVQVGALVLGWILLFQERIGLPFALFLLLAAAQLLLFNVAFSLIKQLKQESPAPASLPPSRARSRIIIFGIMPISALTTPFVLPLTGSHTPQKYTLIFALLFGAILAVIAVRRLAKEQIRLSDHKPIALAFCFGAFALAWWDGTLLMRGLAIERIGKAMAAANEVRVAKGRSLQSATEFIEDLKAIAPGNAPADFRMALADYIRGVEDTMAAVKAKDRAKAVAADAATQAAHAKMVSIAGKY